MPLFLQWLVGFTESIGDPIGGNAGWVGTTLLGSVLSWLLLKHLPDKDKQLGDKDKLFLSQLEGKDKQLLAFIEVKDKQQRDIITEFKEAIKVVVVHCETREEKQTVRWERDIHLLTDAITDLSIKIDMMSGSRRISPQDNPGQAK